MILNLVRVSQSEMGTFGVLLQGKTAFAVTAERPWMNNEPSVSCIPPGEYLCKRVASPRFGNTFEVMGVDRRSHILFHGGNTIEDTHGCILVGEEFGAMKGLPAVLSSQRGFTEFKERTADVDEFLLVIEEFRPMAPVQAEEV